MKLSLENSQKKQRVKNLWKLDYPPLDPEQRWIWIYQVEDHLFGTREMQNELLRAWGFSYTRKAPVPIPQTQSAFHRHAQ